MARRKNIIIVQNHHRELSDQFYEYQKQLGYIPDTCRARQLQIEEFIYWIEQKGISNIEQTTEAQIQSYYDYISSRPNRNSARWRRQQQGILHQKTTYDYLKSVEYLFTMLQMQGAVPINPMNTLKFIYPKDEYEREILTQAEIQQLYKHCETARERAILSLAYGCGLRVGEMEQLDNEDIRFREKMVIVRKGKGNKRRIVPMSPGVLQDLEEYFFKERNTLDTNPTIREHPFMLNNKGSRMREFTFNRHLKIIIERTNNPALKERELSIHSLRHSIATHLIEQEMNVELVRDFLGHSQLETTQIYTHISQEQIKKLNDDPYDRTIPEGIEYDSARSEGTAKAASDETKNENNDP